MFLENLLFKTNHELNNRKLHINYESLQNYSLNRTENEVFELIKSNEKITAQNCSDITGKSLRTIKYAIKSLSDKNLIVRVGGKKYGGWKIK